MPERTAANRKPDNDEPAGLLDQGVKVRDVRIALFQRKKRRWK